MGRRIGGVPTRAMIRAYALDLGDNNKDCLQPSRGTVKIYLNKKKKVYLILPKLCFFLEKKVFREERNAQVRSKWNMELWELLYHLKQFKIYHPISIVKMSRTVADQRGSTEPACKILHCN